MPCATPSRRSRPTLAASIRSGARSTASAEASLTFAIDGGPDIYRAVYGVAQADGTLTASAGDTFIMFVTWDKIGRSIVGKHQPVRLGHIGFSFAPLRRPDAAVRGDENQAGTVHPKPARRKRRGGLPARQQIRELRFIPHADRRRAHAGWQRAAPAPRDWSVGGDAVDPR